MRGISISRDNLMTCQRLIGACFGHRAGQVRSASQVYSCVSFDKLCIINFRFVLKGGARENYDSEGDNYDTNVVYNLEFPTWGE